MRQHLKTTVLVLLLASVGACDRGPERITVDQLRLLVLQPSDVGSGFLQFDFARQDLLDYSAGPRRDPERFGREGGWKARYRRQGREVKSGPLVIESRTDLFPEEGNAEQDLEAYEDEFAAAIRDSGGRAQLIDVPGIGDRVVAMSLLQGSGLRAVRYFRIAWREGNLTAFVSVSGFEGRVSLTDAVRLALRQQARMAATTA